jgi:hypothetical protein
MIQNWPSAARTWSPEVSRGPVNEIGADEA